MQKEKFDRGNQGWKMKFQKRTHILESSETRLIRFTLKYVFSSIMLILVFNFDQSKNAKLEQDFSYEN